jgi:hypothetical protein
MAARQTPKHGIVGEGKLFVRAGKNTNALYMMLKVSKPDEKRLLKMLTKRNQK